MPTWMEIPVWGRALIGIAGLLVAGFLFMRVRARIESGLTQRGWSPGTGHAVATVGQYLFWLTGGLVILKAAGVDLSPLTVIGGAFSFGVGFGLQTIIQNFVAGLIILAERPIKLGDRIQVGEVVGEVVRISFRSTVVVTNDNIDVIIPNADFITGKVTNWTQTNRQVRFSVAVGVGYESDPDQVTDLLLEVAHREEGVLTEPAPDVLFEAFRDSALQFRLRYWTEAFTDSPAVLQGRLNRAILLRFRESGITIPYPQRVLEHSQKTRQGNKTGSAAHVRLP